MIEQATRARLDDVLRLAGALWPDSEALEGELAPLLDSPDAAIYLAMRDGAAIGFAQCQLRHDYVEGTESSPVGYLEGIYVAPEARRQGVARRLLDACMAWSRTQGCREFASDCELLNAESERFHKSVGFVEANRVICFVRKLAEK